MNPDCNVNVTILPERTLDSSLCIAVLKMYPLYNSQVNLLKNT